MVVCRLSKFIIVKPFYKEKQIIRKGILHQFPPKKKLHGDCHFLYYFSKYPNTPSASKHGQAFGITSRHIPVSPYPDTGKDSHHPHQQQNKLFRLFRCPGICRTSVRIQPALIADAYAATVPGAAVRTHFQKLAVLGHTSVTTDIK